MSVMALDRLGHGFAALIDALDGGQVAAIEGAIRDVDAALVEVQGAGAWQDHHEISGRIREMQPLLEAARQRTALFADMNRQMIEKLAVGKTRAAVHVYRR